MLDSAGALLGEFAAIQLELSSVELYEGQPLEDELTELLSDHGYVLWSMEPGMSGPDGRMLQYDGLFVRPIAPQPASDPTVGGRLEAVLRTEDRVHRHAETTPPRALVGSHGLPSHLASWGSHGLRGSA